MSKRADNKSYRRSRPRFAAALLAAFCLNLVLQPCAMALGALGECLDCPPDIDHGSLSHHAAAPAAAASDAACATGTAGCAAVGGYSHEQRGWQLKLKDAPAGASVAIVESNPFLLELRRSVLPQVLRRTSPRPGASPPLNVLYCVYLK